MSASTQRHPAMRSSNVPNHASHSALTSRCQKSMWTNIYETTDQGVAAASPNVDGSASAFMICSASSGVTSHIPFIERNMTKLIIMIRIAANWRETVFGGVASEIWTPDDVLAPPVDEDEQSEQHASEMGEVRHRVGLAVVYTEQKLYACVD